MRDHDWSLSWRLDEQSLLRDCQHRVRVPKCDAFQYKLVLEAYELPFCGYLGMKRTWERLRSQWAWDGIREEVEEVVRVCDTCQKDTTEEQKD